MTNKKQKILIVALSLLTVISSCKKQTIKSEEFKEKDEPCNCIMERAYPDIAGEVVTFGEGENSIKLQKKGDKYIMGGDIVLSDRQVEILRKQYQKSGPGTESTFIDDFTKLWPGGVVYYVVDPSLPNQYRVSNAINHWTTNTSLTFVVRTNQPNYIRFKSGSGCSSQLGMNGGTQDITLDVNCSTGNAIHEIGHAIGLIHEQNKSERDNHINIFWDNIQGYPWSMDQASQFVKYTQGYELPGFDFSSIMLYGSDAFSDNGQPTMTRKDGSTWTAQRNALTQTDIEGVNYLYNPGVFAKEFAALDESTYIYSSSGPFEQLAEHYEISIGFYSNANFTTPQATTRPIRLKMNRHTGDLVGNQIYTSDGSYYINVPVGSTGVYVGRTRREYVMEYGWYYSYNEEMFSLINGVGYRK